MKKLLLSGMALFIILASYQALAGIIQINPETNGGLQINLVIQSSSEVTNNRLEFGLDSQIGGFTLNPDGSINNMDMGINIEMLGNQIKMWSKNALTYLSNQYSRKLPPYDSTWCFVVRYNNATTVGIPIYQNNSNTLGNLFVTNQSISIGDDANVTTTYNQSNNALTITMNIGL